MSHPAADRARQAGRSAAGHAAGEADSPWLTALGRVGVAAIGIVYLLLAWISLQVAFGGSSGTSTDNSGALKELAQQPGGKGLLVVMTVGLFAYVVWMAAEALVGYRGERDDKKRLGRRIGAGGKAVVGLGLGVPAAKLVIGSGDQSSSQKQTDWTAKLLGLPAGRVLVVLIGLGVIGFAGLLIYQGIEKKFLEKLAGGTSETMIKVGQFGYLARAVAFGVLGALVVVAGVKHQAGKSKGLDGALKTLADQPFGQWILAVVAVGLAGYGAFTLITAPRRVEG